MIQIKATGLEVSTKNQSRSELGSILKLDWFLHTDMTLFLKLALFFRLQLFIICKKSSF